MDDVGAWEERMGVRTSSVGLVTSFLERFHSGWNFKSDRNQAEVLFFKDLRRQWDQGVVQKHLEQFLKLNSADFPGDNFKAWSILSQSISNLPSSISNAYTVLFKRLGISVLANGERLYTDLKESIGNDPREADAAILHLLLYPPEMLSISDRLHIAEKLKSKLMRPSGFARYKNDWFLYGGPMAVEFANRLPIDPDMIAVKTETGYRKSELHDRDQIYHDYQNQKYEKNMFSIIEKNGSDLDAQWSFQDSMLAQIYIKIYKQTRKKEHRDQAWFHLARAISAITGENQINIEGASVKSFRAPEAWIPVRLIDEGKVFTVFFTSPNSPLNWTTAELVTALVDYISADH